MMTWRLVGTWAAGGILLGSLVGGCSDQGQTKSEPQVGQTQQPMLGGTETDDHPEVSFTLGGGGVGGFIENGAVLLSPTLAVTQIQAVSKDIFFPPSTQGTLVPCGTVSGLFDPSEVTLYAGDGQTSPPQAINNGVTGTAFSVAKQIITNGEVDTCKGPLAFIVLANPITTISSFPQLQLETLPNANDPVTQCGWGDTDLHCLISDHKECESAHVTLPNGGYYAPNQIQFNAGQLLTDGSDCYDTAGAIYDSQGAILAIMNLTVSPPGAKNDLTNQCGSCQGAITNGVLLSSQASLVAQAFAATGSSPWRVGHPKPADIGGTCKDALDCNSQLCVQVGSQGYCSQDCTTAACPTGNVCTAFNGRSVCLPSVTPHPSGCDVAAGNSTKESGSNRSWGLFGLALAGLIAMRARSNGKRKQSNGKAR